jgi:hypothetical protein
MFSDRSSTSGNQCQTTRNQYENYRNEYCKSIFCDMCGIIIEAGRYRTKGNLHLCPNCFYHLESLGNSIIQSSITRFCSGNVL